MHTYARSYANERTILVYNVFFVALIDFTHWGYRKLGVYFFRRRRRHRRKLGMDLPVDLSRLLFQELFCYQQQFDGYCRVPTKTTPTITPVTPTTLRSFGQGILDYQAETESHQNEAGFVPPLVETMSSSHNSSANVPVSTSIQNNAGCGGNLYVSTKSWQGGGSASEMPALLNLNTNTLSPPIPTHVISSMGSASSSSSSSSSSGRSRRSTGGRRPNKENGMSPEEEQKKKVRRERNKLAAAKCRKKRVELISTLEMTVQELEMKREDINMQNQQLEHEMEELRVIWEAHVPNCRARDTDSPEDVKPYHLSAEAAHQHLLRQHQQQQQQQQHQQRHLMHDEKPPTMSTVVVTTSSGGVADARIYTTMSCADESLIIPDHVVMDASATAVATSGATVSKLRPNTLLLPPATSVATSTSTSLSSFAVRNKSSIAEITGIPITTPSAEFIDALIDSGSTGLTPVSTGLTPISTGLTPVSTIVSCSTQLRSASGIIVDLSSPDSIPSASKLVSL